MVCGDPGICWSEFSRIAGAARRSAFAPGPITSVAGVCNIIRGYRFRASRSYLVVSGSNCEPHVGAALRGRPLLRGSATARTNEYHLTRNFRRGPLAGLSSTIKHPTVRGQIPPLALLCRHPGFETLRCTEEKRVNAAIPGLLTPLPFSDW